MRDGAGNAPTLRNLCVVTIVKYRIRIVVIVVVVIVVCAFIYWKRQINIINYATMLAEDLISCSINNHKISSDRAVFLGENLRQYFAIHGNRLKFDYKINVLNGDLKSPMGDGEAQYRIIIRYGNNFHFITLRVKYDEDSGKFHILGYTRYDN